MPSEIASSPSVLAATRWRFVDALRGFAVVGILLVNTADITRLGWDLPPDPGADADVVDQALNLLVQTRFVPIFIFLFGVGLHFVLTGARRRSSRPGLVLIRRMAALGLIGAALMTVYRGNILTEYGIIGLALVPIVLYSPRWVLLTLGGVLTVMAYVVTGGGIATTPGLMLLGAAAAAYGLPGRLERGGPLIAIAFVCSVAASVPFVLIQVSEGLTDTRYSSAGSMAGFFIAIAYTTGLSLLWRTPARSLIAAVFEPLGRMALSNYVAGAIIVCLVGQVFDFRHLDSHLAAVLLALGVIALQSVASRLWLRHFAYGPVEWLWRTVTWWGPVTLVRRSTIDEALTAPAR